MTAETEPRLELLATFREDRPLAHAVLFSHRHRLKSPDFHETLEQDWASGEPYILHEVFRNGAKSTIAEEGVLLGACFGDFDYCLLVGATELKAQQRLHSIRYEAETNTALTRLFGTLEGAIWSAGKVVFKNGRIIHALGRGQSLRGIKEMAFRPDYLVCDDLEDKDNCKKDYQMQATWDWFAYDLLPALNQEGHRVRVLATPLHPDSLPMRLERSGDWLVRKIPAYFIDEGGKKVSAWPELYPMTRADALAVGKRPGQSLEAMEDTAARNGNLRNFWSEYLMKAEQPAEKPFKREMIRVAPQARTWQPVFGFFDPARTTDAQTSSRTGFAAWSWMPSKLTVWEAWGRFLMPSEQIAAMFDFNERFNPVWIGVEEDGLNQWLLQPIREEAAKRGVLLPLRPMRAPRSKYDFIKSLQKYYAAGEVEHDGSWSDLEDELVAFPHGARMDVVNALAYALLMRKGRPVFDDFGEKHVLEGMELVRGHPAWLVMNAESAITTGQIVQLIDGTVRVSHDWAREGDPTREGPSILDEALMVDRTLRLVLPPNHFERWTNVGLKQALQRDADRGGDPGEHAKGRDYLRDRLQREIKGVPAFLVADSCRWTTAALAGGYSFEQLKNGLISDRTERCVYQVIMEGLESLAGLARRGSTEPSVDDTNAVTPGGRPYKSMLGSAPARVMARR